MQRQILKKMQKKMQASIEQMQEDLGNETVFGEAGGGAVKVGMNGKLEPISIKINPEVVDPEDVEMLEDLIMVALKGAMEKAQELQGSLMTKIAGGLNLPPGLF